MSKTKTVQKEKHGHIDGQYWIWPDGKQTHLRFIKMAVVKLKNLPVGFYEQVEKSNYINLKHLVMVAKSRKLKCTVDNK